MDKIRLVSTIAALAVLTLFLLAGIERSARGLRARQEAHRLVAEALAADKDPARQQELFRRARETDPTSGAMLCEQAAQQERQGHYAEAAASYRACLDSDPQQAYAEYGYAQSLVRARGREAYVEARAILKRFLEKAAADPVAARDAAKRRSAEELILDLEELLEEANPHKDKLYSADDLLGILLRTQVRGTSRYDGPRVPLRLGFRPNDAGLGSAAEEQLREVIRALQDGSLARSRIQIEGHTDSVEGKTQSGRLELSRRRARAVKEFLVERGKILERRLTLTGFADDYPLEPNDTEEGLATNRRVELVNLTTREVVREDVRNRFGS